MPNVKICGITTLADALAAAAAGADYLGFNFHPDSPRYVDPRACARITAVLRKQHPEVQRVGVFVNLPVEQIEHILGACALDLAQLHGDETPEILARLGPRAFKALRGIPRTDLAGYARADAPAFLLDAAVRGTFGGTGQTGDWAEPAALARTYSFFLAGGLNPDNVAEAVRQVKPWGVDVASGVELAPGRKDAARMQSFVQVVRAEAESGFKSSPNQYQRLPKEEDDHIAAH